VLFGEAVPVFQSWTFVPSIMRRIRDLRRFGALGEFHFPCTAQKA
jgi:hypothetical protein